MFQIGPKRNLLLNKQQDDIFKDAVVVILVVVVVVVDLIPEQDDRFKVWYISRTIGPPN